MVPVAKALPSTGGDMTKSHGPPKDSKLPPDVTAKMFERKETGAKHVPVPEQYSDPEKSGFKVTIKGGSTPFDIDIP